MSWNLLEFFQDEQVSATPTTVSSSTGATGLPVFTTTTHQAIKGLMYTRSAASRYFNISFQEDVTNAFVTGDVTNIANTGSLTFSGVDYEVESIDNVASQSDVYIIGLKGRK